MTLDCIQSLSQHHSSSSDFSPYFNQLSAQLSSQTFGDTKGSIREKCVVTAMGLLKFCSSVSKFYEKVSSILVNVNNINSNNNKL